MIINNKIVSNVMDNSKELISMKNKVKVIIENNSGLYINYGFSIDNISNIGDKK